MADVGYRPMGLETDVNNPNFAGAVDPTELMHIEFYWHTPFDRNKTEEESEKQQKLVRVFGEKTIYILIMRPGDQTSELRRAKSSADEIRYPKQWLRFQIQEGLVDYGANQPGWKIEDWKELSQEEVHQLKFLRFYTVEQIAGASDAQISTIMGGMGLRKRASEACKARSTESVRAELDAKDKELQDMKERMAKLEAMMNAAPPATDPTPPPSSPEVQPEAAATALPRK
jgi:hypothetical protein